MNPHNRAPWRTYGDPRVFAECVADNIATLVRDALQARATCLLAVPGGHTPKPVIEHLVRADLPWARITIVPTDDRLVDHSSSLSNYSLLAAGFGRCGARVEPLIDGNADFSLAGDEADQRLWQLPWPPDLMWLGMGTDGHTASIFPGPDLTAALTASERRAVAVRPDPLPRDAPVARVTLTGEAILSARAIIVTITGDAKRAVLEQALDEGRDSVFPIGRVLAKAQQPVTIYWCAQ